MIDSAGHEADSLLGEGHRALVDECLDVLRRLREGDGSAPRILLLEGASGTGKSRVARELYRTLTATQPLPAYWPDLPEVARSRGRSGSDPMPNRKVLGPPIETFVWPAYALPAFTWWPLNCERLSAGVTVDVLTLSRGAIDAHLLPAALAWRNSAGIGERIGRLQDALWDRVREARDEGLDEVRSAALSALGLTVPGLGLAVEWLTKGYSAFRRRRAEAAALASDRALTPEVSPSAQVAEMLAEICHPELPAIVVVEDAHLLDDRMVEFLDAVADLPRGLPFLVVATAWPEGRSNGRYARWLAESVSAGRVAVREVPELDRHDRIALIRRAAPATIEADARAIADRFRNPLAIQLLLTVRWVRERIEQSGGALHLEPAELEVIPSDVRGLYTLRLRELPEVVQDLLMLTAAVLPHPALAVHPPALDCLAPLLDLTETQVRAAFSAAVEQFDWLVEDDGVLRFREEILAEIAAEEAMDAFGARDIAQARADVTGVLEHMMVDWSIAAEALELDGADAEVSTIALWLLALVPPAERETLGTALAGYALASALADASRPTDALAMMDHVPWRATFPAGVDATLRARIQYARWAGDAGDTDGAIAVLQELLADEPDRVERDPAWPLTIRNNLATLYGQQGRTELAVSELRDVVLERTALLGARHLDTMTSRANLASRLGESGHPWLAIEQYRVLIEDQDAALGSDHASTRLSRNNLSFWLATVDDLPAAEEVATRLLDDQIRALGDQHPDTLLTRHNLAAYAAAQGHTARARDALEAVVAARAEVLGPWHPETLTSRAVYADVVAEDDTEAALDLMAAVIADRTRILGPRHPDTLRSRLSHALWHSQVHGAEGLRDAFGPVLADFELTLGPMHPETLDARRRFASALYRGDLDDDSEAELRALLSDASPALGDTHPVVVDAHLALAQLLGYHDRDAEAVPHLRAIATARRDRFGSAHALTLEARDRLAVGLGYAGQFDEANQLFAALADDFSAAHGPLSDEAILSRQALGHWLHLGGREDESLDILTALHGELAASFGEDDTRAVHTEVMLLTRRTTADLPALENLLEKCHRVLDEDDPVTIELGRLMENLRASTDAAETE